MNWKTVSEPAPRLLARERPPGKLRVETSAGRVILERPGVSADSLVGVTPAAARTPGVPGRVAIPLAEIRSLQVEKFDLGPLIFLGLVGVFAGFLILQGGLSSP